MLSVEISGIEDIQQRFEEMHTKLREFNHAIADEFAAWQREDVHRPRADVRRAYPGFKTTFRQHSRYELRRSRLARRRVHYRGRTSTRDILRAELIDKLIARLDALSETLRW
jgi:hypothetical protein